MWVQPHNKMYKNVQAKDNNLCNASHSRLKEEPNFLWYAHY